ncbi:SRPBCC family protein [Seohaeicola nanhaiensis]|uniref:SRPBCC family protein n=1 Tax=Seohaeicola nanhaiensis TaxID=1387282 RepID=A0ABV9KDR4_9RHOB
MQFSTKEDIEAPIDEVFAMLSDFEGYERSAIRRGIEVQRERDMHPPGRGMAWTARFSLRGKPRDLTLQLAQYDRPTAMRFEADSQGLDGTLTLDLLSLSKRRTRLAVVLEVKPKTLSARLLVQSFRLAKATLNKRFKLKVAAFAKSLEQRQGRTA